MGSSFTLSAAVAALSFSLAANAVPYQMTNNWQGGNFFDAFDFITCKSLPSCCMQRAAPLTATSSS